MSRILEFQPTDEHTVVSRVLVELHQAIDVQFPGATPSARQFTKTVLTNQGGESTRIDNVPPGNTSSDRPEPLPQKKAEAAADTQMLSDLSITPKTGKAVPRTDTPLATEELRRLMGETTFSRRFGKLLIVSLVAGVIVFVWIYFGGAESFFGRRN
jgi:hypothetical protein